jgi:hypothetical protein
MHLEPDRLCTATACFTKHHPVTAPKIKYKVFTADRMKFLEQDA